MQEWREIVGFPGYSVSDQGLVRNDVTDRILKVTENSHGIPIVGLSRWGKQYKRSVAVLVANAFVLTARSLNFNTPINLDGDRFNNYAGNLVWRPLWFARKYFRQFLDGPQGYDRPIEDMKTKEIFESTWIAAITFGLLENEIVYAIAQRNYVWPTYQYYRLVE